MAPNPRIDELRKRLDKEPASRLFAQLAEELRKEGELAEAITVCRDGLQKHPNYPSARITLGRALFDTGDFGAARGEFDAVVKAAPDNILASRYLAECHEKMGDLERAEAQYRHTLRLSPDDKQVTARLEAVVQRRGGATAATAAAPAASPRPAPPAPAPSPAVRPAPPAGPALAAVPGRAAPPGGLSAPAVPRGVPSPPALSPQAVPRPAVAVAPPPPPAAAAPPPAVEPAESVEPPPIPLVEADEEFELERSYEVPRAVATIKTTAQEALEREFERESAKKAAAAARWPPVAAVDEGEAVDELTEATLPGGSAPSLESLESSTDTTARFTALDEEAIEQAARAREQAAVFADAVPVIVPDPEPDILPEMPVLSTPAPEPPARRAGLETLFRFSAFDAETAMVTQDSPLAERVPAPPALAPPPPPIAAVVAPLPAPIPAPVVVPPPAPPPAPALAVAPPVTPAADAAEIVSPTIAELYFGQGHIDKAIDVYRRLLRGGPENEKARRRLLELEALDRRTREEASAGVGGNGASRAERRATIERTIARLEALLTVIRKE